MRPSAAPSIRDLNATGRLPLLGVVLLACAAYANALANDFSFDDVYLVVENERIRSLRNLPALFTTDLFDAAAPGGVYYRPLVSASFAIEYAIAGASPLLFHFTNVALHALACGLVYALVKALFAVPRVALWSALLFAVHPVHSEAVAAVSGRSDLLAAVLLLLSALAYARGVGRAGLRHRGAALSCYGLALLAKESAALGLAIFPLIELAMLSTRRGLLVDTAQVLRGQLPFLLAALALTGGVLALGQAIVTRPPGVPAVEFMGSPRNAAASLPLKLVTSSTLLAVYYRLLVFPVTLSADYSYDQIPLASGLLEPQAQIALLVTAGLIWAAFASYRRWPSMSFALAFLLVGTLPLAYALPHFRLVLAERYLYLPSLGACLALGTALHALGTRRAWASALLPLLLVSALARTALRNRDWRDDATLFARTVQTSPRSAKAHANRAITLLQQAGAEHERGELRAASRTRAEACGHYQRSVEIEPGVSAVRLQHGVCLAGLEHYERAERELRAAAQQGRAEAWLYLYRLYVEQAAASHEPARVRDLLGKARAVVQDRIRPRVSASDLRAYREELRALGAQLSE